MNVAALSSDRKRSFGKDKIALAVVIEFVATPGLEVRISESDSSGWVGAESKLGDSTRMLEDKLEAGNVVLGDVNTGGGSTEVRSETLGDDSSAGFTVGVSELVSDACVQIEHVNEKKLDGSVEIERDSTSELAIVGNTTIGVSRLGTDDKSVTAVRARQILITLTRTSGECVFGIHDHTGLVNALSLATGSNTDGDTVLRVGGVQSTTGVSREIKVNTLDASQFP